jgi:hypothetical protein
VPRRLIRVAQGGTDSPVQAAAGRAGQRVLGRFPQQRVAEPKHRVRGDGLEHVRLQRRVHLLIHRPTRNGAQQLTHRRPSQRRRLHHGQRLRAEPPQTAAQRTSKRKR